MPPMRQIIRRSRSYFGSMARTINTSRADAVDPPEENIMLHKTNQAVNEEHVRRREEKPRKWERWCESHRENSIRMRWFFTITVPMWTFIAMIDTSRWHWLYILAALCNIWAACEGWYYYRNEGPH